MNSVIHRKSQCSRPATASAGLPYLPAVLPAMTMIAAALLMRGLPHAEAAPGPTLPPTVGEALYNNNCLMCHGPYGSGGYAKRSIQFTRAARITDAMVTWPLDMGFLTFLTPPELAEIETYLANVAKGPKLLKKPNLVNGEKIFRQNCTYCHTFGNGPRVGMDLIGIPEGATWRSAWLESPAWMVNAGAFPASELALYPYLMPDLGMDRTNIWDVANFLVAQDAIGPVADSAPVTLSPAEFEATKQVYFNRCAGCHGLYRKGATGPPNDDQRAKLIGTDGLGAILRVGTPRGMPNFGQSGILTEQQIINLAAYLQLPAPDPPPWSMEDIQASWKLIVPVASRPLAPEHTRNWQNYFGTILRDAGQVVIFDGVANEEVARLNTGFAVHILRSSSTGRYFYAIGRDGLVSLIDLWTTVPTIVATVKGGIDARSVESSKFPGYEDKYLIEGCYWPPQYVVFDGLTLEPKQRVSIPMTDINGVTLPEVRVASIVSSPNSPVWVLALKESGYVGIVDYSDPAGLDFPLRKTIPAVKFLHDGGFDHTGNYFLLAANANNKMVVVDLQTETLAATIDTGLVPHPGRGVNWLDPVYGWVNATPHIGEGKVTVYSADPVGRPDVAWQVVRTIPLPSAGSLFIKSHPNSPWVLVDMASSATGHEKEIAVISKATGAPDRVISLAANGRVTHPEFNMAGTEIWVADWATDGQIIVLDSTALTEIRRFTGLQTPTGKFNVYNTANDVY